MLFFIALETLSLVTKHWRLRHPIQWWAFRFLKLNFYSCEGAYKKCVRLFDTLGSFFGLAGLLLGLFSLLCDQVGQHIPSVQCTIVAKANPIFILSSFILDLYSFSHDFCPCFPRFCCTAIVSLMC